MKIRKHDSKVFVGSETGKREEGRIAGYSQLKDKSGTNLSYLICFGDSGNRWFNDNEVFDEQYVGEQDESIGNEAEIVGKIEETPKEDQPDNLPG